MHVDPSCNMFSRKFECRFSLATSLIFTKRNYQNPTSSCVNSLFKSLQSSRQDFKFASPSKRPSSIVVRLIKSNELRKRVSLQGEGRCNNEQLNLANPWVFRAFYFIFIVKQQKMAIKIVINYDISHIKLFLFSSIPYITSSVSRPRGLMDKASDFGSEDCEFESRRGRVFIFSNLA